MKQAIHVIKQLLSVLTYLLFTVAAAITIFSNAGASVTGYKKTGSSVIYTLDKGLMKITICSSDIIRVQYTLLDSFPSKTSLVVINPWTQPAAFTVSSSGSSIIISTAKLKIFVDKVTNAITYQSSGGTTILAESPANKSMTAATIAGISTYNCATQFNSPVNEGLFGLGCHPLDSLSINYKGRNQDLAIRYLTGAIPVLLSTSGYGLMWDNYAASNFYGAEEGNTRYSYISESGNMVDYYFFYGPSFDHIIASYRTATGKAPMFGKWAFGLFQSQDRYRTQAQVLEPVKGYRDNHIPVDVIVQDWYYWEPLPIGSHVMNPANYPNPKAMVDELHKANLHGMISIWPVFGSGTNNFNALKAMGGLTGITWDNVVTHTFDTYYDAHNPKARELYWQQARDSLVKRYGWDAWWIDQCEPDNGTLLDERRKAIFYTGRGIDYFNTYSLVHTDGIYKGWRRDIPGKRAFFLARQAFAGQQRNAATLWSSDITCTFDAFKIQVPQGINACTSGIPYWTSDIGGYHFHWQAPDWSTPANRELFTRWFQFGAFCPVFRIHGKGERALFSKNWDNKTKEILLTYDNLRYRLLPYIYSLAAKVTMNDYTIMRSLAFDFRTDTAVYNIKDQYMFGPAFLVNPVTEQLYTGNHPVSGDKTRQVYLPKTQWYNFWTGEALPGGQTINASAPIETMPLYVKAGSIVPMGPFEEYATQKPADTLELRIYPGAGSSFTVYEDENDNYNYEKGAYATFTISWNNDAKQLTVSNRQGSFAGMLKQRVFRVIMVKPGHGAGVGITQNADKTIIYNGKAVTVKM
ncbi:MAG TPA: TIM-barrel domain-containing protein [Chitinophagaceae bacterium]|nr:TIM-barrel domain-containing protein [Chitinophagaceae bacterium]